MEIAINQLRSGKSPGLDGITNEILKKAGALFVPLLIKLFNTILKTGLFPFSWCNALIVPVYKKHGNIIGPGNYRGIAFLFCVGKVFTKIINTRLSNWAIDEEKLYEVQAGFTKGKSTVDQVFVLQSLVSKYISKKGGRCYSVFIDFTKAFDNVSHLHLFYSLIKNGLHGRVIRVLRDMYCKLQSSVQDNRGRISESFTCSKGTRQGCMLSPLMFIFYMNELIEYCKENDCKGIFIDEYHPNVPHIFYADDLVLLGDHIGRLQNVLNNLSTFGDKWGLSVNMEKTNFMVFRNGGIVKKNENVYYKGELIKHATYYKYLGIMMSTRLSWSPAQKTLSLQAAKSMHCIKKLNYECDFSVSISREIFEKCTLPVITYGSEIWGTCVHNDIENVLVQYCRMQLGVNTNAPGPAVLGECGRHGVYVYCYVKCVKYWLKLTSLPDGNITKSCYTMLLRGSRSVQPSAKLGQQNFKIFRKPLPNPSK